MKKEKDRQKNPLALMIVVLSGIVLVGTIAFLAGSIYGSQMTYIVLHNEMEQPVGQVELTDFSFYLNMTCDDNLRFYSGDYGEEYRSICKNGGVEIILPEFNLTENKTLWVHLSKEGVTVRRSMTIVPEEIGGKK